MRLASKRNTIMLSRPAKDPKTVNWAVSQRLQLKKLTSNGFIRGKARMTRYHLNS